MNVNRVDSSYSQVSETQRSRVKTAKIEQEKRTDRDTFERSVQPKYPNYVKYPYGSKELAQAVLATACYRLPEDIRPVIEKNDEVTIKPVGASDGSNPSYNDDLHDSDMRDYSAYESLDENLGESEDESI